MAPRFHRIVRGPPAVGRRRRKCHPWVRGGSMEPGPEASGGLDVMAPFAPSFRTELLRLFRLRRDVRRFRRDTLPEAEVLDLLEAAHTAPSVGLSQPWRF